MLITSGMLTRNTFRQLPIDFSELAWDIDLLLLGSHSE
jgi:hypothetical protein